MIHTTTLKAFLITHANREMAEVVILITYAKMNCLQINHCTLSRMLWSLSGGGLQSELLEKRVPRAFNMDGYILY